MGGLPPCRSAKRFENARVVELDLVNQRLAGSPLEPRAYLCDYDAASDLTTLYATTQMPHYLRRWLARTAWSMTGKVGIS